MSSSQGMDPKENVDDSESIASDESEEMTEVDEDEFDHRRAVCVADMKEIESQFLKLKEELISERYKVIDQKLKEIEDETAEEFCNPLNKLQMNMDLKIKLATLTKDYRLKNIEHIYECEQESVKLTLENEKQSLLDKIKSNIERDIYQLEENRRQFLLDYECYRLSQGGGGGESGDDDDEENVKEEDNEAESCAEPTSKQSGKKSAAKAKSPATSPAPAILAGTPYIVYSLQDYEILEDWSIIKMHKSLSRTVSTEC